jgi:signal transduction histidine kinase
VKSWTWRAFLALWPAAVAVTLLLSEIPVIVWTGVAVLSIAAIVVGAVRNRPTDRAAWFLLAGSQALFVVGDMLEYYPSTRDISDVLFTGSYVCIGAVLLRLVHDRSAGRDRPALLDALAISTGLGLLAWTLLIGPYARDPSLGPAAKVAALAFPIADIAVLSILVRLWSGGGQRRMPYYLLGAGVLSMLLSDLTFSVIALQGTYTPGGLIDLGWLFSYVAFGAAALHPAMGTISQRARPTEIRPSRMRLVLLTAASLVAPAVLTLQWLRGEPIDAPVIAGACVVLFVVSLSRTAWLSAEVTRQHLRKGLLGQILQATEEERTRIASDLHDGPVQQLAVLSYSTHRARRQLGRQQYDEADTVLEKIEGGLEEEVRVLRRLMADLRPPLLDNRGLEAALTEHVDSFGRDAQIVADVDIRLEQRLRPELETVLYRVVQESLNNVAKHAAARSVHIGISGADHAVKLRVVDDGVGFDTTTADRLLREGHFGLAGMRERVGLAGGQLQVQSAPGQGTTIEVDLPLEVMT